MKIPNLLTTCATAAMLTFPAWASVPAATHNQLSELAAQAYHTERDAGRLQSYSSDSLDWMAQGNQLMVLRDDVNALGREVHQLQSENALPAGQQRLLRRVARRVNLLANDTNDAIRLGRNHRDDLFNPMYGKDISRIDTNATRLNHDAATVLKLANSNEG